jgi:hypothetical protein
VRGFREGFAKSTSAPKLENQIWDKVWSIVSTPGLLENVIQQRIEEIQSQTVDAEADCQKLQRQLDELLLERQMVIGYARKNIITEEDLETQLLGITIQQGEIERQMEEAHLLMGNRAERLQELADMFREKVRTGSEELNNQRSNPALEDAVRKQKRKIVQAIVKRVDVFGDKTIKVHFLFDFPELVKKAEFVDISYPSPWHNPQTIRITARFEL